MELARDHAQMLGCGISCGETSDLGSRKLGNN